MQGRMGTVAVGAVIAGALAVAGCGSSNNSSSGASSTSGAGASASSTAAATSSSAATSSGSATTGGSSSSGGGNKTLALIQGTKADNFYVTMGCGAQAEAKKLGYKISVQGPADFSAPEQIPIVNSVQSTKPGAVLIAPTDSTALIGPMKSLKSAGIKVIQVDTTVSDTSIAAASISSDNIKGGEDAAGELAKEIGDKGSVVVMNEQAGVSTTEQRIQGFMKGIKKFPNIHVLQTQFVGDNPSKAAAAITSLFSANQDLAGVFATNVLVAQGVDTGLKNAGVAGKVKIVGYDADPTQIQDLKSGVVQALVAQEPFQEGVDGVQQAVNAIQGKATKSILTKTTVLTKANLAANSKFIYKSSC
jgi:ribose transport system substrate-binding protein